jgi:hypothetical protein
MPKEQISGDNEKKRSRENSEELTTPSESNKRRRTGVEIAPSTQSRELKIDSLLRGTVVSAEKVEIPEANSFESLLERFPAVNSLNFKENNIAHINDEVLVHTRNTYKAVQKGMGFEMVSDTKAREALKDYFRKPFAGITRSEALETAAFLHDIAKTEANMTIEEGTGHTYFPDHEAKGAELARGLLEEEGKYEKGAVDHIVKLIGRHSEFNSKWYSSEKRMEAAVNLKRDNPDIYFDLILLSMADMQGSQLEKLNPKEYNERMDDYSKLLNQDPTDILR